MSDLVSEINERCEARADDLLFLRHAQAVAVIRAVLARHRSVGVPAACEWCEEDWPCVTVLDVASALGVREDGED